jgi:hypothetical protein
MLDVAGVCVFTEYLLRSTWTVMRRRIFLSYNSVDRSSVDRVRTRLERTVDTFFDQQRLALGKSWFQQIQSALPACAGVAVFLGREGLGRIQTRELWLALDQQATVERSGGEFPVFPVLLEGFDPAQAPRFLMLNAGVDLRASLDDEVELSRFERLEFDDEFAPAPELVCPYRGLQSFREQDHPYFFGRAIPARQILEKIQGGEALIAVVGGSGAGKSSLVQAGVLPALRKSTDPIWEIASFNPGNAPWRSLAGAFAGLLYTDPVERLDQLDRLAQVLERTRRCSDAVREVLQTAQVQRLLLVADQFEELFTQTPEQERAPFLEALLEGVSSELVTLLITLRSDYYGNAIAASRALNDLMQTGIVNVDAMSREELRLVIEQPAEKVRAQFEPGVVDLILRDVDEQPNSLPLLEFALQEMWQLRSAQGRLTKAAYDNLGSRGSTSRATGLAGAIGKRADEAYAKLSTREQTALLSVMTRLVRLSSAGEAGTDTRRRIPFESLSEVERRASETFVKARLLILSADISLQTELDVAHEELIRRWQKLRDVLEKQREFYLWRQRLGFRLDDHEKAHGAPGTLLTRALLSEACGYARQHAEELSSSELAFIRESVHAARRPLRVTALVILLLLGLTGGAIFASRTDYVQIELAKRELSKLSGKELNDAKFLSFLALDKVGLVEEASCAWWRIGRLRHQQKEFVDASRRVEALVLLIGHEPYLESHWRQLLWTVLLHRYGAEEAIALAQQQKYTDGSEIAIRELQRLGQRERAIAALRSIHAKGMPPDQGLISLLVEFGLSSDAREVAKRLLEGCHKTRFFRDECFLNSAELLARAGDSASAKAALAEVERLESYDRVSFAHAQLLVGNAEQARIALNAAWAPAANEARLASMVSLAAASTWLDDRSLTESLLRQYIDQLNLIQGARLGAVIQGAREGAVWPGWYRSTGQLGGAEYAQVAAMILDMSNSIQDADVRLAVIAAAAVELRKARQVGPALTAWAHALSVIRRSRPDTRSSAIIEREAAELEEMLNLGDVAGKQGEALRMLVEAQTALSGSLVSQRVWTALAALCVESGEEALASLVAPRIERPDDFMARVAGFRAPFVLDSRPEFLLASRLLGSAGWRTQASLEGQSHAEAFFEQGRFHWLGYMSQRLAALGDRDRAERQLETLDQANKVYREFPWNPDPEPNPPPDPANRSPPLANTVASNVASGVGWAQLGERARASDRLVYAWELASKPSLPTDFDARKREEIAEVALGLVEAGFPRSAAVTTQWLLEVARRGKHDQDPFVPALILALAGAGSESVAVFGRLLREPSRIPRQSSRFESYFMEHPELWSRDTLLEAPSDEDVDFLFRIAQRTKNPFVLAQALRFIPDQERRQALDPDVDAAADSLRKADEEPIARSADLRWLADAYASLGRYADARALAAQCVDRADQLLAYSSIVERHAAGNGSTPAAWNGTEPSCRGSSTRSH